MYSKLSTQRVPYHPLRSIITTGWRRRQRCATRLSKKSIPWSKSELRSNASASELTDPPICRHVSKNKTRLKSLKSQTSAKRSKFQYNWKDCSTIWRISRQRRSTCNKLTNSSMNCRKSQMQRWWNSFSISSQKLLAMFQSVTELKFSIFAKPRSFLSCIVSYR